MREHHHGRHLGRVAVALLILGASLGGAAPGAAAPPSGLDAIRACPTRPSARVPVRSVAQAGPRLRSRLDADGTLRDRSVRLGRAGRVRLGIGAFVDGPFGDRAVVGERAAGRTRLVLLELRRRCAIRRLEVAGLVYGSLLDRSSGALLVSLVAAGSRRELGVWRLGEDAGTGPTQVIQPPRGDLASAVPRSVTLGWSDGPVATWCAAGGCETHGPGGRRTGILAEPDSGTEGGQPAVVSPRPVPEEPAPRWPRDAELTYRWHGTETPPSWMRGAINAAAEDVTQTKRSRTPTFRYASGAPDAIRYTDDMPAPSCSSAIACASYDVGTSWTIRLRPQGTDFRWGTLRWCQTDDRDGCFDVERVMLHEFGHIVGIDHPESMGFTLKAADTVMGSLAPAKPKTGSFMHTFGPCDVATLQERYDVPATTTSIAACNDVDTTLALSASAASVPRGTRVTIVAELRIPDRDAYGRLGGNALSERSVQLLRRPSASVTAPWTTFQMRPGDSPGTYLLTIQPTISYDFRASFGAPGSEGLDGSASPIVSLRVLDGCGVTACPNGTEDPME